MQRFVLLALALSLTGCIAPETSDYGMSMKEFYTQHPKQARVETKRAEYTVYFTRAGLMTEDAKVNMHEAFAGISPMAADTVMVSMPKIDNKRADQITRELHNMGYTTKVIMKEVNPEVVKDTAEIAVTYAVAVLPDCPNWQKSGVHNYSNTFHSNMRCPLENNLAAQVADPRDLEGSDRTPAMNGERNGVTIQKYYSGADITGIGSAKGSSSGSASGGSSSASSSASSSGSQ